MKLKRYIFFVLLVLVIESALLYGISLYFHTNLANTWFIGSLLLVFFAFIMSSTGEDLPKRKDAAIFEMMAGPYEGQHKKTTLSISPFLVGSILCFIAYFVLYYSGLFN